MPTKPKLPELPLTGLDPWLMYADDAERASAAYFGGKPLIDKYLRQHPRECDEDYDIRRRLAYGLERTKRAVNWLTRTVDNAKYAVERDFGPSYPELQTFATHNAPSGKSWDSQLKQLLKDGLLGSVAYIFLDRASIPPTLDTKADLDQIRNTIESAVLTINQVWDIVLTPDGYISQCSIISPAPEGERLLQYYITGEKDELGAGIAAFRIYTRKNDKHQWQIKETGPNPIGVAPLVPFVVTGSLTQAESLRTNVQAAARLDVDIMNLLSDSRQAFDLYNFPILAMSEKEDVVAPRSAIAAKVPGYTEPDKPKVVLSAATGVIYNKDSGEPFFLEPDHLYFDKTLEFIRFGCEMIDDLIGVNLTPDHPLASGIAKEFDAQDQSEIFRDNHSRLEAVEYQCWYLIARMISPDGRAVDFNDFKEQVTIAHPVHFDPTGGYVRERLEAVIKSPLYATMSPEIKLEISKQWLRANLEDIIPDEELTKLLDTIKIQEPTPDDNPDTAGTNPGNAPNSGGTSATRA